VRMAVLYDVLTVAPVAERPVRESGPGEGVWGNREVPPATKVG
jgi:hypothetical protein